MSFLTNFWYLPFSTGVSLSTSHFQFNSSDVLDGLQPNFPISFNKSRVYSLRNENTLFNPCYLHAHEILKSTQVFDLKFNHWMLLEIFYFLSIISCDYRIIHINNQNWLLAVCLVKKYEQLAFASKWTSSW